MTNDKGIDRLLSPKPQRLTARLKFGEETEGPPRYDTYERSRTNLNLVAYDVQIYDARAAAGEPTFATHGFQLFRHESESALSGGDDLEYAYHHEMAEFIRQISGTPNVFPQRSGFLLRHAVRSVPGGARPAQFVHMDYTEVCARKRASLVYKEFEDKELQSDRAFAIYQTWRVTSAPPQDSLLAVCDGRTITDADWQAVASITGPESEPEKIGEIGLGRFNASQRWYYFSGMTHSEVLIFRGFDSRLSGTNGILHTSFSDSMPGEAAIPRSSIEARFFAFFD